MRRSLFLTLLNLPIPTQIDAGPDLFGPTSGEEFDLWGRDEEWRQIQYVGTPLTDAHVALSLAAIDWGQQGMMLMDDEFQRWALGKHEFTAKREGHPYLGCNNDRMSHVPKGVVGLRMDGVEDVVFSDLQIYDLAEYSDLGSELCGPYWDEKHDKFDGGGHFLQNAPYLYGYTGNMAHGLFLEQKMLKMLKMQQILVFFSRIGFPLEI